MNETIKVITVVKTVDRDGFDLETRNTKELYAEVNSAWYKDVYETMANKQQANIEFTIRKEDFDDCRVTENKKHFYPTLVEWEGAEYSLIRWRYKGLDRAVMICG